MCFPLEGRGSEAQKYNVRSPNMESKDDHTFNLKAFIQKRANYEGAQGYMRAQTRAWMNCTKLKMQAGSQPQEAWFSCCDEFQKGDQKMDWVSKYASDAGWILKVAEYGEYQLQMGPYWDKIQKKVKSGGKTMGQAVMEALEEFQNEGSKIPSR